MSGRYWGCDMGKFLEALKGKRTFIAGFAGLAVIAGQVFGLIDPDTAATALAALGFTGAITLRAALK